MLAWSKPGRIELKKSGKDWLARGPFHADDTASLVDADEEAVALLRLRRSGD